MANALTIHRAPGRGTNVFNDGYLEGMRSAQRGDFRPNPYCADDLRAAVWAEGWTEWLNDLAAGSVPPHWRIA